jgi:V/A-type H+-transporting ATPase subunit I
VSPNAPAAQIEQKLEEARTKQKEIGEQVVETVASRRGELEDAWKGLRHGELVLDVRSYFEHTERAVVFSGWVPQEHVSEVDQAVRRVTEGRCYITWYAGREVEQTEHVKVPVRLKNPRLLKPFQMLVENYGTPAYGTVDPTLLVAAAYLVMFGLMFADAGHGLVLLLAGILGLRSHRVRGRIRELFGLVVWCAGSAILFGVLFGSYFGMQLLPPVWFDFHGVVSGHAEGGAITSIFDILALTIYLGITVIGLGFILNWINLARRKRWVDVVFDRAGLITAWLYAGGIYTAFEFVQSGYRELPGTPALVAGLVLPAALLLLKEPVEAISGGHDGHASGDGGAENGGARSGIAQSGGTRGGARHGRRSLPAAVIAAVANWLLELLEVGSGYLANTLSFMRVAGLGIAHVTLMTAFFEIASLAAGDGGYNVFSIIILILGNALVIGLEGLSAGIQSLRLNYYEFFSKYFSGSGEVYRPISLAGRV